MKKIYVFFGSEETGFEEECIGVFSTVEEAKERVSECLADDFSSYTEDELMAERAKIEDNGYEGEDENGNHIIYMIGEEDFCLSVLYGLREDFLEELEFEDEDEDE